MTAKSIEITWWWPCPILICSWFEPRILPSRVRLGYFLFSMLLFICHLHWNWIKLLLSRLSDFSIGHADQDSAFSAASALSVEQCDCPDGYSGTSCEVRGNYIAIYSFIFLLTNLFYSSQIKVLLSWLSAIKSWILLGLMRTEIELFTRFFFCVYLIFCLKKWKIEIMSFFN